MREVTTASQSASPGVAPFGTTHEAPSLLFSEEEEEEEEEDVVKGTN
tara:strand:- start:97 stop:237 length:141 start_codon:yes stop_codon:yes gene_type:complete